MNFRSKIAANIRNFNQKMSGKYQGCRGNEELILSEQLEWC